jgi:predicted enzyme related to lactoylglutathione lyase
MATRQSSWAYYWRIQTTPSDGQGIDGGLLHRPFPGPRSWVHYVHVASVDEAIAQVLGLVA